MVGRDFAKTVGRSVVDIATQRSTREAIAKLGERVTHGMREPATMRIDLETGGAVDVEVTVSELPEQSVDARFIVVLRNVTQRSAELNAAAHERLESRWKALFARTTAITYTLDRELRFKSSSGGGLTAIGLIPGQVVGMSLHEFFDQSPDRERTLSLHQDLPRTGFRRGGTDRRRRRPRVRRYGFLRAIRRARRNRSARRARGTNRADRQLAARSREQSVDVFQRVAAHVRRRYGDGRSRIVLPTDRPRRS
jgi:hypothetical protein